MMSRYDELDEDDFVDVRIDRPHDDHTSAQVAHWGGFLTGFLLPLILLMVQKDKKSFAAWHARESLNFQISLMLYYGLCCVPMCLAFVDMWFLIAGLTIMCVLAIVEFVLIVLASLAVGRGERYRYPLTIRLVSGPTFDRNPYYDDLE